MGLRYERYFGRKAYAHLFVTKAMRYWVNSSWHLEFVPPLLSLSPPSQSSKSEIKTMLTRASFLRVICVL